MDDVDVTESCKPSASHFIQTRIFTKMDQIVLENDQIRDQREVGPSFLLESGGLEFNIVFRQITAICTSALVS